MRKNYAQGKKDFISKLGIALKEASETGYWLELAYRTNYIDEKQYKILSDKCATLRVMLVSSCKTAKANQDNKNIQNLLKYYPTYVIISLLIGDGTHNKKRYQRESKS